MKPTRRAHIHDRGDDLRHHLAAWDREGFTRLLRAGFTKFRTVRAWVIALCAAAIVFVLLSFVSASASRAPVPAVPTGPGGEAVSGTYMFVHRTLAGDGALTARVAALSGAHTPLSPTSGSAFGESSKGQPGSQLEPGLAPWAKAGIILEPDTNQGTAHAAVMVTGSHGVQMQYDYTHDSPGIAGAAGPSSPRWLRLTRAGDVITGYDSADGAHWTEIGTARLARLPRTVQIGLFVTSPVYFPAGAFTISGSGDIAPLVGDIISAQWAGASIVNGTIAALLFVIVIATLFATSEYRRGLINHPRRQPDPRPCPGRHGRRRRIAGLRRRNHRNRGRRRGHPPRPGRQRELPLPAKRACPGPGHHRHRAPPGARRGAGRRARHDAAARRRGGRRRHRAPGAAGRSRLSIRELADAVHPDRGLRHPGHPAPLRPGNRRLHTAQRLLPDQPLGRPRRARRLHRGGPGRSHMASPPPRRLNAAAPSGRTT